MYEFFRGVVCAIDSEGWLSLDVGGVGYRLRVSEYTRSTIPLDGSVVTVHARLQVKDDDHVLFGFADPAERAAFDLLTSVQGVGPSVAMNILSVHHVTALKRALAGKDAAALAAVKGIGAKSAQRIVLELHDKVERIPVPVEDEGGAVPAGPEARARDEARQGLIALGFPSSRVGQVLDRLEVGDRDAEALLREALNLLR